MQQTAIRLSPALANKLRQVGGNRGMNEEIRRRLEASFETDTAAEVCLVAAAWALQKGNAEWFLRAYGAYWNLGGKI